MHLEVSATADTAEPRLRCCKLLGGRTSAPLSPVTEGRLDVGSGALGPASGLNVGWHLPLALDQCVLSLGFYSCICKMLGPEASAIPDVRFLFCFFVQCSVSGTS